MDNKILDKITKILKLTENNNENEAQNALLLAQRLMMENGITMQDLSGQKQEIEKIIEKGVEVLKRRVWYNVNLAGIIAPNFRCKAFTCSLSNGCHIMFFGKESDVEIARTVYLSALEALKHHAKQYAKTVRYNKTPLKNAYINGYIRGLDAKFKSQIEKSTWGLVAVIDPAVEEKYRKDYKMVKKGSRALMANNADAHSKGYSQGFQYQQSSGYLT